MTEIYVVMADDQPWLGWGNGYSSPPRVRAFTTEAAANKSLGQGKSHTATHVQKFIAVVGELQELLIDDDAS